MNDRSVALLDQYDIEVNRTRKGRGAILCDTAEGCLILKEYTGNEEKLIMIDRLLQFIKKESDVQAEVLMPTKEGGLSVKDGDGTAYILKTFCEGRECNTNERDEYLEALELMAKLHEVTAGFDTDFGGLTSFTPGSEYEKRNKELKKVRKYLLRRGQKSDFEICLQNNYGYFLDQALEVAESWAEYEAGEGAKGAAEFRVMCHGDYKYHNIVKNEKGWFLINFEKCVQDNGVRDLYLFMRKLLEKSGWSIVLGKELIKAYDDRRHLERYEFVDLYHRLAYPEKFWKIVNFYYNSRKSWIPGRNMEKLEKLMKQEEAKCAFLEEVFGDLAGK